MPCKPVPAHLAEAPAKRRYNRWLFGIVAKHYNQVTGVLSFGRDTAWKKWLVSRLPAAEAPVILDIASGNGDIAFRLADRFPRASIIAADLTREMFALAQEKRRDRPVVFVLQDMSALSFRRSSVDFVTGGYALRNAPDLEGAIAETRRVLKPNGTAVFLDFSKPPSWCAALVEHALLKLWGSLWGLLLHGRPEIYGYIADSLKTFPDRRALHSLLEKHDLTVTESRIFFFGVIEVVFCKASDPARRVTDQPRSR